MHRDSPSGEDNATLLAAAKAGDERARDQLLESNRSWIRGYFRNRVGASDADDLTQQTLIAAAVSLARYREEAPFSAWLLGIANRLLRRYWERDPVGCGRLHLVGMEGTERVTEEFRRNPPGQGQREEAATELIRTMEKFWLSERLLERMRDCCSEEEQHILLLYYQGENLNEIAALLQVPDATVRSHLHRARGKLLAYLVEHDPGVLGGEEAIGAAWERAEASSEPPTEAEREAWTASRRRKEPFRAACLRMARFLPVPALLLTLTLPQGHPELPPESGRPGSKAMGAPRRPLRLPVWFTRPDAEVTKP